VCIKIVNNFKNAKYNNPLETSKFNILEAVTDVQFTEEQIGQTVWILIQYFVLTKKFLQI